VLDPLHAAGVIGHNLPHGTTFVLIVEIDCSVRHLVLKGRHIAQ
jgi:hypothetical protein